MHPPDPRRQRLAIWGAGREGRAVWQWLRQHFPQAPLQLWDENEAALHGAFFDQDPCLQRSLLTEDMPLPPTDLVIKSPGIPLYQPRIRHAQEQGTRFTSGSNLWRGLRPDTRVIAVTGTKGKSTTAALLAHLLQALGQKVVLAGNIGLPLLETLDRQADWWVVEFSSYQLADLDWHAPTALLLNLAQEHLDWHGSLARYQRDKLRIFGPNQLRVLPAGLTRPAVEGGRWLAFDNPDTVHIGREQFMLGTEPLFPLHSLKLPGRHNRLNAAAALTCLHGLGFDLQALEPALSTFSGLPHRLQTVCTRDGIQWVNDSISTTPEASLAAIEAMGGRPVTLIVGGHDRGLDWRHFAQAIQPCRQLKLLLLPESGWRLDAHLKETQAIRVQSLEEAVAQARRLTPAGGVCLLSPGSPSYGMFRDYEERGEAFTRLACKSSS